MIGTLTVDGQSEPATRESLEQALAGARPFWLDLGDAAANPDALAVLSDVFHFHPLAVEDADHFGQRPKLEDFDDYSYMVVHGARPDGNGTIEVHIFVSELYTVTLHRGECKTLADVRERLARHHATTTAAPDVILVYLIVDTLTDSFFPVLSAFDDQIDSLEDAILQQPTEQQLGTLFDMKRQLLMIRKVVTPQRDMFASLSAGVTELPGMVDESARYFRDLYDHLIRISDLVDNYRDLLSGVMDTHISTVSNRLNAVMKQLTIIATIFLPLSFLTGFFGQNFAAMVTHIGSWAAFIGLGIGTELAAAVLMLWVFKRRGWFGGPST
jgi:magnesium transporter